MQNECHLGRLRVGVALLHVRTGRSYPSRRDDDTCRAGRETRGKRARRRALAVATRVGGPIPAWRVTEEKTGRRQDTCTDDNSCCDMVILAAPSSSVYQNKMHFHIYMALICMLVNNEAIVRHCECVCAVQTNMCLYLLYIFTCRCALTYTNIHVHYKQVHTKTY